MNDPVAQPETQPEQTRYAAYDTQYLRYVGGTHGSKSDAKAAAKAAGVDSSNVRVDEV